MNKENLTIIGIGSVTVLLGLVLFSAFSSVGSAVGGSIPVGCVGTAWTNGTSTVNTTATQVLTAANNNCPALVQNRSANPIFCFLEQKTPASSSVRANAGILLPPLSSSTQNVISFGPNDNEMINGRDYNLNCLAQTAASEVLILKK